MPVTAAAVMAGGSLLSGLFGASSAKKAAQAQANAQLEAARIQAEAAKFKPYNITTGFGTSQFDTANNTAGYTLDPRLAQMRDLLYGGATGMMPSAGTQQFYGDMQQQAQQRAMQAMGMSPQQAATSEYQQLQDIMAPGRSREEASLAANLFKSGRGGYGTSYGAGSGYINPQQYSLMKAREEQNQQLAMTALDRGRQQQSKDLMDYFNLAGNAPTQLANLYTTGSGLFGKGLALEEYGLKPLELGINIGGRATQSATNAAQALAGGITGAAGYQAAGAQAWPQAIGSAFQTLGRQYGQPGQPAMFATGANPQLSTGSFWNPTGYGSGVAGSGYSPQSMGVQQQAMLNAQWPS